MFLLTLHANRKLRLCGFIIIGISLLSMLQGCLGTSKSESQTGLISGRLTMAKNLTIIASKDNKQVAIPVDSEGNFSARLSPGFYQLSVKAEDGTLSLFRRMVQVENNISLTIVDTDLVPIPQIKSVSVPLVYKDSAVIEWYTDIESDGYVEYGTNELYGYSSFATEELKIGHRLQLYNLLPGTTYHFRVIASRYNLESSRSISRNFVFTTEP